MGELNQAAPTVLLADADVLIDYRDSELEVLKLIGQHVGPVTVLSHLRHERSRTAPPVQASRRPDALRYGLELMVALVASATITAKRAMSIAYKMHESNPLHINDG